MSLRSSMNLTTCFSALTSVFAIASSAPRARAQDSCATPGLISDMLGYSFDNTTATTGAEGQQNSLCQQFGTSGIARDLWFTWTSTRTGTASIELCGLAAFDSKIAVYEGASCPTCAPLACNDDSCGLQSRIDFQVVSGAQYIVQIGSYPGAAGGGFGLQIGPLAPQHAPILHYKFDNAGNMGADSSGHGHTGVLGGATTVNGPCSNALHFHPNNDVQEFRALDSAELDLLGEASGSAWVRPLGPHAGVPGCMQGTIMSKAGNYWFQIESNNDALTFQNEGSGNFTVTVPITPLTIGRWTHLAFVRQANLRTIDFYVDGLFAGQATLPANSLPPGPNDWPLQIGNGHLFDTCELNGDLDEIKLWNVALNAAEIYAECQGTPHPNPPTAVNGPTEVCQGGSAVLSAAGGCGDVLEWFRGSCDGPILGSGGTLSVSNITSTTTYYARWRTSGCAVSDCVAHQITVRAPPQAPVAINASPSNPCAGSPVTLTAVGGSGAVVKWYTGACGATLVGTGSPTTVFPTSTTTYFARWENPPCAASACIPFTLTVTPPPAPPTSAQANPQTICSGQSSQLTASGGSGQTLVWTSGSPTGPIVGAGNPINVSPSANTTYYAHYERAPCAASPATSVAVSVLPSNSPPTSITFTPPNPCAGTGTVTLNASGGNGTNFEWFSTGCGSGFLGAGSSITIATPAANTTYFARRISATCPPSNCLGTTLIVIQPPTPPTSITPPLSICAGASTTLSAGGGSGDALRWYAGSTSNPSIGQGPSIVVTPASTTTYFARWERLPCGLSTPISTTVTVDVVPSTPTFASATPNLVCAGVGTIVLDVVGNGPGNFDWYADGCGGTYVGSGPSLTVPAPLVDTTYFVRRSNGACSPSGCISVAVDTEATPVNDSPSSPITLVAETRRFNTTCAHDDVLAGSTLVRSVVYHYAAPITACGTVQISVSPPSDKGMAIYTDPLGATTPVATGIGSAVFQAAPGQVYTIFAGDVGAASGVGFITLIEDVGVPSVETFTLTGNGSGTAWSWRISSNQTGFPGPGDYETLLDGNVSGVAVPPLDSTPLQVAQAFANSINAAAGTCSTDHISALVSTFFPVLSIAYDERPTPPGWGIRLWVGPYPGTATFDVRESDTVFGLLPAPMSIRREPLPGEDCNENGFDDVIDVLAGTSVDADGNGIPDECSNNTAAAYCFGDGTGEFCPCGNNGAHGNGCANSQDVGGAKLSAIGVARVANDSVLLQATGMTGVTAIFFQGGSALPPFTVDDGLGCVGGPIIRLGTKSVTSNSSSFPESGDPSVSVRGQLPPAGGTRYYQCFYRNAASAFCPPATSNRTNGLVTVWQP